MPNVSPALMGCLEELGRQVNVTGQELRDRLEGSSWAYKEKDVLESYRLEDLKKFARVLNQRHIKSCVANYSKMNKTELVERLSAVMFVRGDDGRASGAGPMAGVWDSRAANEYGTGSAGAYGVHNGVSGQQGGGLMQQMHAAGSYQHASGGAMKQAPAVKQAAPYQPPNYASRRVRSDPFFRVLKILVHKDVTTTSINLNFNIDAQWMSKDGHRCSVRARIFELQPSPTGLLQEIGWAMQGQLMIMGHVVQPLPKKKKSPEHQKHSNYLSAPVILDNYIQPGSNTGRVFSSGDQFIIVVQHGILRTVDEVEADIKRQTTSDPLDTKKLLVELLGDGSQEDDDLVCDDRVEVTTKCPLSFMRIGQPARGRNCRHAQCFDLVTFLEFAKRHHNWLCPICSTPVDATDIRVDSLFEEVLRGTSRDTERAFITREGAFGDLDKQEVKAKDAGKKRAAESSVDGSESSKMARTEGDGGAGGVLGGDCMGLFDSGEAADFDFADNFLIANDAEFGGAGDDWGGLGAYYGGGGGGGGGGSSSKKGSDGGGGGSGFGGVGRGGGGAPAVVVQPPPAEPDVIVIDD